MLNILMTTVTKDSRSVVRAALRSFFLFIVRLVFSLVGYASPRLLEGRWRPPSAVS